MKNKCMLLKLHNKTTKPEKAPSLLLVEDCLNDRGDFIIAE